jgi:hypothetical protein
MMDNRRPVGHDSQDAGPLEIESGAYMGPCVGSPGTCDPGLTCETYFWMDGGVGGGGEFCTHACDAGCPLPSPGGCDGLGDCPHP